MPRQLFEALDFVSLKEALSSENVKNLIPSETLVKPLPNRTISILAVDDDAGNRELLSAYLEDKCFNIQFAENGVQALELFKEVKPDMVIADLRMPFMNGFELAQAIQKYELENNTAKNTPFILLTADALEETSKEAKNYPISSYLTKPIKKRKLLEAIYDLSQTPYHKLFFAYTTSFIGYK